MERKQVLKKIQERIAQLEAQLADLESRLPAHSIPASLIAQMDQLDERILAEKNDLKALLEEDNLSG